MPILIDRRTFLGTGVAAAMSGLQAQISPPAVRWALLSDAHVAQDVRDTFRGFQPAANLGTAVTEVSAKRFDGCLVNGDLARQRGLPADYARFAEGVAPLLQKFPLALSLGNHDHRQNALAAFSKTAGERPALHDKWVSVVESGPVRIILLDSLLETEQTPGLLGKAQREWLDSDLRAHANRPTIIFVHHTLDDRDSSLLDADRFLRIVTAQRHVKAVLYGHSHAYQYTLLDDLHLVNIPATGYNFEDREPVGWVEAEFTATRGQLTLHAFAGNRAQDGQLRILNWR